MLETFFSNVTTVVLPSVNHEHIPHFLSTKLKLVIIQSKKTTQYRLPTQTKLFNRSTSLSSWIGGTNKAQPWKNHHPEWNLAQFKGWLLNWHEEFCQFVRSTIDSAAIELDNKYPFYGKYGRLVYTFHDKNIYRTLVLRNLLNVKLVWNNTFDWKIQLDRIQFRQKLKEDTFSIKESFYYGKTNEDTDIQQITH